MPKACPDPAARGRLTAVPKAGPGAASARSGSDIEGDCIDIEPFATGVAVKFREGASDDIVAIFELAFVHMRTTAAPAMISGLALLSSCKIGRAAFGVLASAGLFGTAVATTGMHPRLHLSSPWTGSVPSRTTLAASVRRGSSPSMCMTSRTRWMRWATP